MRILTHIIARIRTTIDSKRERGFTLVETLVAVIVLMMALVAPMSLAQRSLMSAGAARDEVTARYLARGAAEYVKNIRDTGLAEGATVFTDSIDPCIGKTCVVDTSLTQSSPGNAFTQCSGTCPVLRLDASTGRYGYTGTWDATKYTRTITFTKLNNADYRVTTHVMWPFGSITRDVTFTQNLFDFSQATNGCGTPRGDGLIGWWTFDEPSGTTAYDSSPYCNNGLEIGTPTPGHVTGKLGYALDFNSTYQRVDIGRPAVLINVRPVTMIAWIKPRSDEQDDDIDPGSFGKYVGLGPTISTKDGVPENDGWAFALAPGNQIMLWQDCLGTNMWRHSSDNSIALNTWQQVAVTWDGSSNGTGIRLYVNGVETGYSDTHDCSSGVLPDDSANSFDIGGQSADLKYLSFDGYIDDFKMYDRVLTPAEILAEYNGDGGSAFNPTENLAANWQFDEGSGSTAADDENSNNGTLIGSPAWQTGSNGSGHSLNFNGSNQYMTAPDNSTLDISGPITISAWAKTATLSQNHVIVSKKCDSSTNGFSFSEFYSQLEFEYGSKGAGSYAYSSSGVLSANTWQHVVVTFDGTNIKFYVNGVDAGSSVVTPTSVQPNSSTLYVGAYPCGGYYFNGNLDNVRVFSRALSSTEVASLYSLGN
jgi:Tfp pilus assembly protein PilV